MRTPRSRRRRAPGSLRAGHRPGRLSTKTNSADDHDLSLAALVERTGLPKTSVYRIAGDLVEYRLLDRTALGYRLSGGLFELGMRASVERSLLELAMPYLQDLYERTHETVHLGVREGREVVYVAKIAGRRQAASPSADRRLDAAALHGDRQGPARVG